MRRREFGAAALGAGVCRVGGMTGRSFGPRLTAHGVDFRIWAPNAKQVEVVLDRPYPMLRDAHGWYTAEIAGIAAGARYRFRIDGSTDVPDPGSLFQPEDIAGPSEVIDHTTYPWRAKDWRGRPWAETVLLEAHVGTFTPEGTFRAMIDKLDHLVEVGITALELMPIADFPGMRNWGYDGVLWYAPDSAYGRPEDLKALIDEAHLRGLMVFLDVVYNHFGPERNYLGQYAPEFFSHSHTPWGNGINYYVDQVRAFAIENALHWLRDYHFDGLRLDAVHAIPDQGEIPMLLELSRDAGRLAAETGRYIHLVLENDDNTAAVLDPVTHPPRGQYRAQWNDDYHHAWHVALSGETHGYYSDYADAPLQHLARALSSGFVYQGEPSEHRGGVPRGEPSGDLAPLAFVNFLQNHDQIGNRALGDRLESLAKPQAIEAALAITLLAPTVPMLFMGEEWGSQAPFPFFCDFHGDLAEAVRAGRRKEFAGAYAKYGDNVPDPLSEATFRSAVLDWHERDGGAGAQRLALVKRLLAIRRGEIVQRLKGARFGHADVGEGGLLRASWRLGDGATLALVANLSDAARDGGDAPAMGTILWGGDWTRSVPPWAVFWRLEQP
jgi:1,4-alpha-glucan branching enzyme/maltooligosyltrehalose trehalohydrolase